MLLFYCALLLPIFTHAKKSDDLIVLTVGTDDTHGLQRFERSARIYNIQYEVLGKGQKWQGGDMARPGGGHKVNLLRQKLEQLQQTHDKDSIVMFTDSYDVVLLGDSQEILKRYRDVGHRLLFAAEPFCWPDASLAKKYPATDIEENPSPYLNSGGFIGTLADMLQLLSKPLRDGEDDQLYYTQLYLDEQLRADLDIALDHRSQIFQSLNGAFSEVALRTDEDKWAFVENTWSKTRPLVLHGNGPAKRALDALSNYVPRVRTVDNCQICDEKRRSLKELPRVTIAVFVEQPTPFLQEFFQSILDIDYPKKNLDLFVHNAIEYHESEVEEWFARESQQYASAKRVRASDLLTEADARQLAKDRCAQSVCEYLFSVESVARVTPGTLRNLLASGFDVVAPLLARPGEAWSNFWGALTADGYYARAHDYMDIVNGKLKGIWNVPFINACYLINMELFRLPRLKGISYSREGRDPDMAFCESLRDHGVMLHVSNEESFGHLVNPDTFDTRLTHPDIYQLMSNRRDWESRYIAPEYWKSFDEGNDPAMPCPDVYWFPLMTERFCQEWIDIMEAYGKWSDGSNKDTRLEGGYEAVPTRDIHMKQVGLEVHWLTVLKDYVRPLQEMVFIGYFHNPPVSLMNFVVRYRPDEQPSLRPHHDSSTYTINLALNTPEVDYTGGGCHFLRYKCSVRSTRRGWLLMHPGRLTHYHEGLPVTNGTRYIMISFVDP
ncbi:unnamed protein product [Leptosia nina]|uniref:procollagen-lysine 5-dioxygenase n=1 Tax=Leptosia nina TaxID=320188 RepID=A0AAV1K1H0_9NEOP